MEGTGFPQTDELILGQLQRLFWQKGDQALGFLVGWLEILNEVTGVKSPPGALAPYR